MLPALVASKISAILTWEVKTRIDAFELLKFITQLLKEMWVIPFMATINFGTGAVLGYLLKFTCKPPKHFEV
jgi:hypothetical protein